MHSHVTAQNTQFLGHVVKSETHTHLTKVQVLLKVPEGPVHKKPPMPDFGTGWEFSGGILKVIF